MSRVRPIASLTRGPALFPGYGSPNGIMAWSRSSPVRDGYLRLRAGSPSRKPCAPQNPTCVWRLHGLHVGPLEGEGGRSPGCLLLEWRMLSRVRFNYEDEASGQYEVVNHHVKRYSGTRLTFRWGKPRDRTEDEDGRCRFWIQLGLVAGVSGRRIGKIVDGVRMGVRWRHYIAMSSKNTDGQPEESDGFELIFAH